MAISYIICAAGAGKRFQKVLGNIPKALITIDEVPLLEWSLQSLPIYGDDEIIFITQREHQVKHKLLDYVRKKYRFNVIKWFEVDALTRGQLETAFLVKDLVSKGNSIAIFNCDTYFQSKTLYNLMQDPSIDGIVPCAQAEGDSWSFCKVNENDEIIDIKEKERISNWCSVGLYYFKDAELFFSLAKESLDKTAVTGNEYYIAPLYQQYIKLGLKLKLDRVTLFKPMGTPEQMHEFWGIDEATLKLSNKSPVLVVDLDNTITIDDPKVSYENKTPNLPIINKIKEFKAAGWEIVIFSSRRMNTYHNDESKIIASISKITVDWLNNYEVPFDGLKFGKPFARHGFYVDDKAMRPDEFLKQDPKTF